jgi:hypothetical protein
MKVVAYAIVGGFSKCGINICTDLPLHYGDAINDNSRGK